MSADNWTICPNCKRKAEAAKVAAVAKAEKAYGKVPAAKYAELLKAAQEMPDLSIPTLREDYDIGTDDDGQFRVTYSCGCGSCGWGFSFKRSQDAFEA